jgi:hypothetical protein
VTILLANSVFAMRIPKAIKLLNSLSDSELEDITQILSKKKRDRSRKLLKCLLPYCGPEFSGLKKEAVYQAVFGEAYSPEKDYLLRDQFRKLVAEIEDMLIRNEILKEAEANVNSRDFYLLSALQEKNLTDLFEFEYKEAYQRAMDHLNYYAAHSICGLNLSQYLVFREANRKNLGYARKINMLQLTHLSSYYLTAFRKNQVNNSWLESMENPFSLVRTQPNEDVEVNFNAFEDDFSVYLFLKAKSFLVPFNDRAEILKVCLAHLEEHLPQSLLFLEEQAFCLANLAKVYSLKGDLLESETYFQQFFRLPLKEDDPYRMNIMFDYFEFLILQKKYKEASNLLDQHEAAFQGIEKLRNRFMGLKIACYAFLREPEELREALPINFSVYDGMTKYFLRFYYGILSYLRSDFEDAYREIDNFLNSIRNRELEFDIKIIVQFYQRFFYLKRAQGTDSGKQAVYFQKLAADIDDYLASGPIALVQFMPFLWLREEMEAVCEPFQ